MALDERLDESSTRGQRKVIEFLNEFVWSFRVCACPMSFGPTSFPMRVGMALLHFCFDFCDSAAARKSAVCFRHYITETLPHLYD
jgi:hypothetical protein